MLRFHRGLVAQLASARDTYVQTRQFGCGTPALGVGNTCRPFQVYPGHKGFCCIFTRWLNACQCELRQDNSIVGHADWKTSALGHTDGTHLLARVQTRQLLAMDRHGVTRRHEGSVNFVAPDGNTLASASSDKTIRLWDAHTGKHLQTLSGHIEAGSYVAFSADGLTLASASYDKTIRLWDASTGECLRTLLRHRRSIACFAFSTDGLTLASGSGRTYPFSKSSEGEENTIRLWNVHTGESLGTLKGDNDGVSSLAFSINGGTLASGGYKNKAIQLWNTNTRELLRKLEGHTRSVNSVAFSPDGSILASGSWDKTIRLWDAYTWEHLRTLNGHTSSVVCTTFSPDGKKLASGSLDDTIRLWEVHTGECQQILQGHTGWVESVGFSPDGHTLTSGSEDGTILLWDLTSTQSGRQ